MLGAVTAEGQDLDNPVMTGGAVGNVVDVFRDHPLPKSERERLSRLGFVQIDARGIFAGDRYAASDEIADVTGDVVRLTVPKNALMG